jgi:hypothetical protein
MGEAELLEVLESAGERCNLDEDKSGNFRSPFKFQKEWLTPIAAERTTPPPYLELEGAVREMHLSAPLEFHLWAYDFYRIFIESSANLNDKIQEQQGSEVLELLVKEAIIQAQIWISHLPLAPELALQAKSVAQVPWIRFRTTVLNKIGRRPVVALG